jgi:hypothetical protein
LSFVSTSLNHNGEIRFFAYISHIHSRDPRPAVIPHTLDHLVEDLAGVRLGTKRHLQPVHPPLGILAGCALDGHVGPAPVTHLLELAYHCLLVRDAKAKLLVVDYLELVFMLDGPTLRNGRQSRFRVDENDLGGTLS